MAREVDDMLARASEVMARHGATPAAIAAQGRRVGRAAGELGRRAARAVGAVGAAGAGLAGYSLAVAPIGIEGLLIAAPVTALAALGLMVLPTRREVPVPKFAELPLTRLIPQVEDWLVRRRPSLPREAGPLLDRLTARLHEMATTFASLASADPTGVDAQRLIGDHLPRLIDAYCAVPVDARTAEVRSQLTGGLTVVAHELDRFSSIVAVARAQDLEVEKRFLETRYHDGQSGT